MASLISKKKANQLYYYVVESARVDGKPRIVHQTYLGTAEKVAALVKQRTAPLPLEATAIDFGLPGALWLAARQSGVFELLEALWPAPKSGPSAYYPVWRPSSPRRRPTSSTTMSSKARLDGKPRIVHQTYLGTAEKVAALVKQRTAHLPAGAEN